MMTTPIRLLTTCLIVLACSAPALAVPQAPKPEQQTEYVPIDKLPPQDQLPAAPLLIGAYSFVVAVLFVYLFSVARRLGGVHREVQRLEGEIERGPRT